MRRSPTLESFAAVGKLLASLVLVVTVMTIGLKALDSAPSQIERFRATANERAAAARPLRFESIEEAEEKLQVELLLPVYFPDYLNWPAAAIYAQRDPVVTTLIFRSKDLKEGLLIRQGAANGSEPRSWFAEPLVVQKRSTVTLNLSSPDGAVDGLLIEGQDGDGAPRNQLVWKLADRNISLVSPYPVPELVRIAESIHDFGWWR